MKGQKLLMVGIFISLSVIFPVISQAAKVFDLGDPIGGPPDVVGRIILEYFCSEVNT